MKRPSHKTYNIRRRFIFFFALALPFLLSGSRPTASGEGAQGARRVELEEGTSARLTGAIMGRVVDPRNNPVGGAQVSVPGRSAMLTNGRGQFVIRGLAATERLPVSFSARGFMSTTRIYRVGDWSGDASTVVIWPRAAPVSLDATRGGKLTFPAGTISLPPRSLVDEAGRALQGPVKVSFSSFDVSDRRQVRNAPGDFTARMRDNRIGQLETFGVFEVFAEDSKGRRANLAKGRNAAVELFIPPVLRRKAPRRVGLYSFDSTGGVWIEKRSLELLPTRASYTGFIDDLLPHWNADMELATTCIKLKIFQEDGTTPVPANTRVEAEGVTYAGASPTGYTYTSTGEVCLSVKNCQETVRVIAYDQNNSAINSCPVRIQTPCKVAKASDCADPLLCPLQPQEIILPSGTLYHDLNNHDPVNWEMRNNGTNYISPTVNNFYDVWWYGSHVVFNQDGIMRLLLDQTPPPPPNNGTPVQYSSGEYRTTATYGYGTYEVCMKPAKGPGLMTSFFTYIDPTENSLGRHDEIDIEFRGKDTTKMWTNFFSDYPNTATTNHEQAIQLNFDAAEEFHRYKFVWTPAGVKWYVDGQEVFTGYPANSPWPTISGKIMMNLWCGNSNSDTWLDHFSPSQIPVTAEYDWVRYKQP